jgi:diacylglycerol kinase family enzyme
MKDNVLAPLTLRLQGLTPISNPSEASKTPSDIPKNPSESSPDQAKEEHTLHIQSRNLAICNARFFGGGMMIAPHARPDDGLFDLINFSHPSRLHLLPLSQSLYQGKHLHQPHIQSFRASSLSIELDDPSLRHRVLLDVDGEALGHPPLHIEMLPAALSLRF